MGRTRVYIRVLDTPSGLKLVDDPESRAGREIHGLSIHRPTGQYYSREGKAKRYWGNDLNRAVRDFQRATTGWVETPTMQVGRDVSSMRKVYMDEATYQDMFAKPEPADEKGPTIRDALAEWTAANQEKHPDHVALVRSVAVRFSKAVGRKPVSQLTAQDLADWRAWVKREGKRRSAHWMNAQNSTLATLVNWARDAKPSWGWPAGIGDWLRYRREAYQPSKKNRSMMPKEVFDALIKVAQEWAEADPEQYSKTTQKGRAMRLVAQRKQLEGLRWVAILRLAANCALDRVDYERLGWDNLERLDGKLPYMDLPRQKQEGKVGIAVDRLTPLLPSTVKALQELREADANPTRLVFRTARGGAFSPTTFTSAFENLLEEAGVERSEIVKGGRKQKTWTWSFKHLRNIGPSLAKRAKRSRDERDALLGHAIDGTSRFYEDDCDESYLLDLINCVGREYFGGEQVLV